jgi:hypothetical protein
MVLRNKDFVEGNFYTNFIEKSQILNQLICTPYLKKEFESSYIGDLKEEEIANLVYSIYKNIKADKKGAIKDKKVSNWIASSRNYRNY